MVDPEAHDDPEQLELRLLARLSIYRKAPPERALFRELIDVALGEQQRFTQGGYAINASTVHHVATVLYLRSNAAGIIMEFSVRTLARDARLGERAVRAALGLLHKWRVIRSTRSGRRRPAEHRLNVGGLDWPGIRARVAQHLADNAQQSLGLDGQMARETRHDRRGYVGSCAPLPPHNWPESGRTDRTESGRTDRTRRPESGRTDRTQGFGTYGRATKKFHPPNPPSRGTKGSQLEDHHQTPMPCEHCGGLGMVQHHCERHEPCGEVPCSAPGSAIGHAGSFMVVCACRKGKRMAREPMNNELDKARLNELLAFAKRTMSAAEREQLLAAPILYVTDADLLPRPMSELPEGCAQAGVDDAGRVAWVSLPREAAA